MFARKMGGCPPTAGLHFTHRLMAGLDAHGVSRHFVTLHVGPARSCPCGGGPEDHLCT